MNFFVKNYSGELPSEFAMFQASSVIFKFWFNYIFYCNLNVTNYNYFLFLYIRSLIKEVFPMKKQMMNIKNH